MNELTLQAGGVERLPPFNPGSTPAEIDACRRLDPTDPVSKVGCMVYDERGAVFREDIFKEPVEKYVPVHFPHRFTIIPRGRPNKTVICPPPLAGRGDGS